MTYHRILKARNTKGAASGARKYYPSGTHSGIRAAYSLVFSVVSFSFGHIVVCHIIVCPSSNVFLLLLCHVQTFQEKTDIVHCRNGLLCSYIVLTVQKEVGIAYCVFVFTFQFIGGRNYA